MRAASFVALFVAAVLIAGTRASFASDGEAFRPYTMLVNEYSERRRTNKIFPNDQIATRGVQVGHVNSRDGNATFAIRDLIVPGKLPISVTRVYDSSSKGSLGFGKGWRLSIAETINPSPDGTLTLTDASGSTISLEDEGDLRLVGIREVSVSRSRISLEYTNGFSKSYSLIGDSYKLARVESGPHSLSLSYDESGYLDSVSERGGAHVLIDRNGRGQISAIRDSLGRQVTFSYENGLLAGSVDLGEQPWSYDYNRDGGLISISNTGGIVATFTYDNKGRAKTSLVEDVYTFRYANKQTLVNDGRGRPLRIRHSRDGTVSEVTNALGVTTAVSRDSRSVELTRNGERTSTLTISNSGSPVSLVEHDANAGTSFQFIDGTLLGFTTTDLDTGEEVLTAVYNDDGSLASTTRNGELSTYSYDDNGEVSAIDVGGKSAALTYSQSGLLESVTGNGNVGVRLHRGTYGRVERVEFPDGTHSLYGYNDLGLRSSATRGDSAATAEFEFDSSGSMFSSNIYTPSGGQMGEEIALNASGRVDSITYYSNGTKVAKSTVEYDSNNNPIWVKTKTEGEDDQLISFEYDRLDRITEVTEISGNTLTYDYSKYEPDLRISQDPSMSRIASMWRTGNHTFGILAETLGNL